MASINVQLCFSNLQKNVLEMRFVAKIHTIQFTLDKKVLDTTRPERGVMPESVAAKKLSHGARRRERMSADFVMLLCPRPIRHKLAH